MTVMDFPSSPIDGQTTTDGRYYFDSSVGSTGAWRSAPLPVGGLPAGSIMAWGTNTPPANWLLADGSAVSRETYSSLFAVIGIQYGAGNGTSTFNLPDLRGRVPVGKNAGTFGTLGATGGAETHTLTEAEMPAHTHRWSSQSTGDVNDYLGGSSAAYGVAASYNSGTSAVGAFSTTGGSGAHNNLQPYQVVNYIIKASAGWTAGDSELATRLGAVETANATTNKSGLVPIIPSSVVVSGGTATVNTHGMVTVSGTASVSLNGLFNSSFTNYRAVFNLRNGSNAEIYLRFRKAGSDLSTGYYGAAWLAYYNSSSGIGNPRVNGNGAWVGYAGAETNISGADIAPLTNDPAISVNGFMRPLGATFTAGYGTSVSGGVDGFTVFPSTSAVSGTIQVYGYR